MDNKQLIKSLIIADVLTVILMLLMGLTNLFSLAVAVLAASSAVFMFYISYKIIEKINT